MRPIERFGLITVLGLALASLGIIAPIAWDLYRSRTALEVQLVRSSTIVASAKGIDKLRFIYDSVNVPELSRLDIAIVNAGRTPIVQSQFVSPLILTLRDGRIIDVAVSGTEPPGVAVQYSLKYNNTSIQVSTPLLNARDAVYLTLLTTKADPVLAVSGGRITGVRAVVLRDQREPLITRPAPRLTWSFYFVAVMTALLILLLAVGIHLAGGASALERASQGGLLHLPRGQSAGALTATIKSVCAEDANPEIQGALNALAQHQPEVVLTDAQTVEIETALRTGLSTMMTLWPAFAVLLILLCIGSWYVITRLL
jgi:hypothetical protein